MQQEPFNDTVEHQQKIEGSPAPVTGRFLCRSGSSVTFCWELCTDADPWAAWSCSFLRENQCLAMNMDIIGDETG
ncbi:UNVERIFIED_CONTAM: hypothetical protein N8J90_01130 [Halobacillus marinus]